MDTRISLPAARRRQALVEWNDTDSPFPRTPVHEMVAAVAVQHPDLLAVSAGGAELTFGELEADAVRLAGYLGELGVEQHDRVAVMLERGVDSIVAQLAVFKLAAAVVLLDPEYPAARIGFILDETEVAAIITRDGLADRLTAVRTVVSMDGHRPLWRNEHVLPVPADRTVTDGAVSHIAFTSGSTGVPKAVQLRHGPFRNTVRVLAEQCGLGVGSRGTWLCSPGFGLVEVDFFPVLAAGGSVLVPDPAIAASPEALRDWMVSERVTHTLQLTAMAERLWTLAWPSDCALRSMRVAGERIRAWPSPSLPFSVLNVYGSAEANVVATCDLTALAAEQAVSGSRRNVPIGRPVANVRTYVLDDRFEPVAPGSVGELYISGAGLSLGYLNRAEANAAKFLANPITGDPYPVLYRSGDHAQYWADGTIEVVGRTDDEVKIRGYRVHPGEVESVLAAQPGVRQCVVVAREDTAGERRLVAYVEPDPVVPPQISRLREVLARALPVYMLPGAWVIADLPTTANGKIDRAALPMPPRTRPDLDTAYQAPRDPAERLLAELWSQVLGIDDIGVLDDFFELGGDSLNAVRLLTGIRQRYDVPFSLDELYRSPNVEQAARAISDLLRSGATAEPALPQIEHDEAGRYQPFELTETQQALWIGRGNAVELGDVGCHGYFEWEHDGLDVDRFRRAWGKLLARHDMLRTVIRPDGTQVTLADVPHDGVTVVDLTGLTKAEAERRGAELRAEMSHQVMDCGRWPLFDVRLSVFADGRVRLHLGVDLLVMDAWSCFQVLFPDLIDLYEDPRNDLPALEITFRDYLVGARRAMLTSPDYQRAKEYWLDRLATLPPAPQLPMVANPKQPVLFDRREHKVEPARWSHLKDRANQAGVTPSAILVAAFAEVLRAWSGNDRFTINFPIFDRHPLHPQVNRVLGDFTNTMLVAVEQTDGTVEQRARSIQEQLWRDLEHRHFNGIEVLRALARRNGGTLRPAMPIVVTSLLGQPPRRQVSALGREIYGISQTPQVMLDFQIREIDGILHLKWDFLAALYPAGMIDAMFTAYLGVLDGLIDDERTWHAERLPLVPESQLRVRAAANDTEGPVRDVLLHEMLAQQASVRPAAEVVITSRRRVTYRELFAASNRIGRGLRARGTRPGELVAVVTEKGWEQYAAVYGVLTSGAAYLPIDAAVPAERLAYLLANGEARFVLTQPWLVDKVNWPAGVTVLSVGEDFEDQDSAPLTSVQRPTDPAYVIYTSGSTGRPKGVVVDHRAVVNLAEDVNRRLCVGPDDRAFGVSGLHFDLSVYDLFGVVAAGGSVVLPDPSDRPDPDAWIDLLTTESVTFINSVPQLLELILDRLGSRGLDTLRTVLPSGDWIPLDLPDRLWAAAPQTRVCGGGGPTETVCWSILYPVRSVDPDWASIPYGRPITNQRFHILDARDQDCPDWTPGRIVVGSEIGLAKGYWQDQDLTARRFFALPSTGERVYDTGDLGRYLPDGTIEFLGREDFQVKVQGHRIELGEIETTLERHPDVRAAAVVAPRGPLGRRRLTAFVVTDIPEVELTAFLRDRLPVHLVPGDVRLLDELPLTGNGKVDRLRLAELACDRAQTEDPDTAPTPLEQVVAGLAAQVLGLPQVTVTSDFFQLGGDSLSATRLVSGINETFGVDVPLGLVFKEPTARRLSAELAADPESGAQVAELAGALVELMRGELADADHGN